MIISYPKILFCVKSDYLLEATEVTVAMEINKLHMVLDETDIRICPHIRSTLVSRQIFRLSLLVFLDILQVRLRKIALICKKIASQSKNFGQYGQVLASGGYSVIEIQPKMLKCAYISDFSYDKATRSPNMKGM